MVMFIKKEQLLQKIFFAPPFSEGIESVYCLKHIVMILTIKMDLFFLIFSVRAVQAPLESPAK